MTTIEIKPSKTKSGATVQVAWIPLTAVDGEGPERMHWRAVAIAQEHGCAFYRVMDGGRLVAAAKAGAQMSQERAARLHGDGGDWSDA